MNSTDLTAAAVPLALMETGRKIMAFVTDDASIAALRIGLGSIIGELDLRRGSIRQAIRHFEKDAPSRAVIVDVSGDENPQGALDDLARVCPPDVQVFVIGESHDIVFYRLLVQDIGVSEYLPKPLNRDAVQRLLLSRLSGQLRDVTIARGGQVIAVCGARGGVGATTIAVSLAQELTRETKGHVALLDLHLQGGNAALMLSGTPGPGLRIALEDAERADTLFLERAALEIEPRLKLIAAQEPFDAALNITAAGVTRVLDLLQRKFNYVVVDLPPPLTPEMRAALTMARQVVVVMKPDVASLRDAHALRGLVRSATGTDRTITVLNRADLKGGLQRALIERGLGTTVDSVIPDLGRKLVEAVNLGESPVRHVPALRKHLASLVREVAGVVPASGPATWLRRLIRA